MTLITFSSPKGLLCPHNILVKDQIGRFTLLFFFSNICPMVMTSRRTNASNYLKEDFYLFIFVFLELLTIPFFPLRRLEDSFMLILFFYFSFLLAINVEPAKMQFLVAVLAVYHRKKSQIRSFSLAWSSSFSQLPRDFK